MRTCRKLIRIGYDGLYVVTVGHTSLWQDILYDYGPFLTTFALKCLFARNMIKPDRKSQYCSKMVLQGQIWPYYIIYRNWKKYTTIISHIRSNLTNLVSECRTCYNLIYCTEVPQFCLEVDYSFKLDILDHTWPPLPTTCHTGPVDDILCSICH